MSRLDNTDRVLTNDGSKTIGIRNNDGSISSVVPSYTSAELTAIGGASALGGSSTAPVLAFVDGILSKCDGSSIASTSSVNLVANSASAASANTAAIQAALNLGGVVTISQASGSIVYINDTLVIYSNTTLKISDGVMLKQVSATTKPMLRNNAYLNNKVDVAVNGLTYALSGGFYYVTVATAAAHGLVVGDYASIQWADKAGYNGVFLVDSVANSTTFTYRADIKPVETPSAISSKSPNAKIWVAKADQNITVEGGIWDRGGYAKLINNTNDCVMLFANITKRVCKGQKFLNHAWIAIFTFAESNAQDLDLTATWDNNSAHNSQIVGINAPAKNNLCSGLHGSTRDDVFSFANGMDPLYLMSDPINGLTSWFPVGDIVDCKVENVYAESQTNIIALYKASNNYTYKNIIAENIGGKAYKIIHIGGSTVSATTIEEFTIRNLSGLYDQSHAVNIHDCTVKALYFEGVSDQSTDNNNNPYVYLGANATVNFMSVKNYTTNPKNTFSGSHYFLQLDGSSKRVDEIVFDGCAVNYDTWQPYALVRVDTNSSIGTMIVKASSTDGCGYGALYLNGGSIDALEVDAKVTHADYGLRVESGTIKNINLLNYQFFSPAGWGIGAIRVGATANISVYGSSGITLDPSNPKPIFDYAAGGVVKVYNSGLSVDVGATGIPANVKGQLAIHSSSVAGRNAANQQGLAVCNGTNWYALATGASGVNTLIV